MEVVWMIRKVGEVYLKMHSMREELREILNALDSIESDMGTKNAPYRVLKKLFDEKSKEVTAFENMEIEELPL
jgi:arsenate reductase-like glutaredoxin family protein